jgi:hypothetical protein
MPRTARVRNTQKWADYHSRARARIGAGRWRRRAGMFASEQHDPETALAVGVT